MVYIIQAIFRMPSNLLRYNEDREPVGINLSAIKHWIVKATPHHTDLQPYLLVHYRAKAALLEELAKQATTWQLIIWTSDVVKALTYVETLIDGILEADETTYSCDLRQHVGHEICPNRRQLILPDPEEQQVDNQVSSDTDR